MQYKYFGEKTVQINRCVLNAVHAAMTKATLIVVNSVVSMMCFPRTFLSPRLDCSVSRTLVAVVQKTGPAQLLRNVRAPTGTSYKP